MVYLNATLAAARANVWAKFARLPYGPEDLEPQAAPVLVTTEVPRDRFGNAATQAGLRAAGLPETYPLDERGEPVAWNRCQPIGQQTWDDGLPGIACLSAAPSPSGSRKSPGEELAWFQRARRLKALRVRLFEDWFWPR